MNCSDCGDSAPKLYEDFRSPPLDTGDCLCLGCSQMSCVERMDEIGLEKEYLQRRLSGLISEEGK